MALLGSINRNIDRFEFRGIGTIGIKKRLDTISGIAILNNHSIFLKVRFLVLAISLHSLNIRIPHVIYEPFFLVILVQFA